MDAPSISTWFVLLIDDVILKESNGSYHVIESIYEAKFSSMHVYAYGAAHIANQRVIVEEYVEEEVGAMALDEDDAAVDVS